MQQLAFSWKVALRARPGLKALSVAFKFAAIWETYLQFLPLQPAASSWLEEDKSSIWQGSCQRNHKPTPKHVNNTGPGPGKPPPPLEKKAGASHALIKQHYLVWETAKLFAATTSKTKICQIIASATCKDSGFWIQDAGCRTARIAVATSRTRERFSILREP